MEKYVEVEVECGVLKKKCIRAEKKEENSCYVCRHVQ